ncbi:MAG: GNAT family N-acetyltransferase [Cellulosilyticum sp.]|nr:GNAT family N-acetyltransferase [Cellulosilyticum sp.]
MRPVGTCKIETERLELRRFTLEDAVTVHKYWASDEKIQSLYSEPVYGTIEEVRGLLNKYISGYERDQYYRWAVVLKETGECIGQIAYFLVDEKNNFVEMEYCIGSQFQRQGLATEAAKAVIVYAFKQMSVHKVQICHKSINMPSRRVIEKCGFVYEGTLRDYFYMNGDYVDRLYYSILEKEFYEKLDYSK